MGGDCLARVSVSLFVDRQSEESPAEPSGRRLSRKSLSLFSDDPDIKHLVKWDGKKYTSDRPR